MAAALREAATWVGCDNVVVERVAPAAAAAPLRAALAELTREHPRITTRRGVAPRCQAPVVPGTGWCPGTGGARHLRVSGTG